MYFLYWFSSIMFRIIRIGNKRMQKTRQSTLKVRVQTAYFDTSTITEIKVLMLSGFWERCLLVLDCPGQQLCYIKWLQINVTFVIISKIIKDKSGCSAHSYARMLVLSGGLKELTFSFQYISQWCNSFVSIKTKLSGICHGILQEIAS